MMISIKRESSMH